MNTTRRTVTAVVLLAAFAALAHGDEKHLKGVVSRIEGSALTLAVEKGEPVVVATDEKTELTRGDAKVAMKDVVVGDRVVIHAKEHGGKLIAHVVKLGKAPKATAASRDAGTAPKSDKAHDNHKH